MIDQIVEFNKTFVAQKEFMVVAHSHCGACHMSYIQKRANWKRLYDH